MNKVIEKTRDGGVTVIGGGDTASLVRSRGKENEVTYVSTGGGASLEFLQGIKLPGVESLSEASELK